MKEENLTSLGSREKGHVRGIFNQQSNLLLKPAFHRLLLGCLQCWNCHSFGRTRLYGVQDPVAQSQLAGKASPRDIGGQWLREFYFFCYILHLTFPTKYVLNSQDVLNTVV